MEHLVELQVRVTRAVIITPWCLSARFSMPTMLVKWLRIPLQKHGFMPSSLSWVPTDLRPFRSSFSRRLKRMAKCQVAGLFASRRNPVHSVGSLQFVVPGLHAQERRFVGPLCVDRRGFLRRDRLFLFFVLSLR